MEARTIVVGDIHGCYDKLMQLLDKVGFAQSDRLVSVGDLITKGPKSREVLDLFMSDKRFSSVIGKAAVELFKHDKISRLGRVVNPPPQDSSALNPVS